MRNIEFKELKVKDTYDEENFYQFYLKNLQILLEAGADYEYVMSICNKKSKLKEEVGLAKAFLRSKRIKIGDTF